MDSPTSLNACEKKGSVPQDACSTCATLLSASPAAAPDKASPRHRRVSCCQRIICGPCQARNARFASYCPFCQISSRPTPLPQRLRDPPPYAVVVRAPPPDGGRRDRDRAASPPPPYTPAAPGAVVGAAGDAAEETGRPASPTGAGDDAADQGERSGQRHGEPRGDGKADAMTDDTGGVARAIGRRSFSSSPAASSPSWVELDGLAEKTASAQPQSSRHPSNDDPTTGSPSWSAVHQDIRCGADSCQLVHFLDHGRDSVASLSLRYGVSAADLRRANRLTADHLLAARRTVLIPAGGRRSASLSPRPVENEADDRRRRAVRRFMVLYKIADYDLAELYLEHAAYDVDAAAAAFFKDEAWERRHPLERSTRAAANDAMMRVIEESRAQRTTNRGSDVAGKR